MEAYLVGGAVRDRLLGLPVTERDWVIVGASEDEVLRAGFLRIDADFPVFVHPETGDEYALARRETKTGPGYKGFTVAAGPHVSLAEDLARRDLTINAMAMDQAGALIDPYGGREDLAAGLLRHVTPAFVEDPVRLLRIARFAAKLGRRGFRVAHGTHALLQVMAQDEDLTHLHPDRVWRELRRALAEDQPWRFFEVLQGCGALERLLPTWARTFGERVSHGAAAAGSAPRGLRAAAARGLRPELRFAALVAGAVQDGADPVALMRELAADRAYVEAAEQALAVCSRLGTLAAVDGTRLVAFLNEQRAFSRRESLEGTLAVCCAVQGPKAQPIADRVLAAFAAARAVDAAALAAAGLSGQTLRQVLDERRAAAVTAALRP